MAAFFNFLKIKWSHDVSWKKRKNLLHLLIVLKNSERLGELLLDLILLPGDVGNAACGESSLPSSTLGPQGHWNKRKQNLRRYQGTGQRAQRSLRSQKSLPKQHCHFRPRVSEPLQATIWAREDERWRHLKVKRHTQEMFGVQTWNAVFCLRFWDKERHRDGGKHRGEGFPAASKCKLRSGSIVS